MPKFFRFPDLSMQERLSLEYILIPDQIAFEVTYPKTGPVWRVWPEKVQRFLNATSGVGKAVEVDINTGAAV